MAYSITHWPSINTIITMVFMSIIPPHYSFVTSKLIWNKKRNLMHLIQTKRKDTVWSEQKVDSTFFPHTGKPTRLFLLDKNCFQYLKSSRLFLLTRFFNFSSVLFFEPILDLIFLIHFVPLLFVVFGDSYLGFNIYTKCSTYK